MKLKNKPIDKIYYFFVKRVRAVSKSMEESSIYKINEPRSEKPGFLHMRKQRRRSAVW